MDTRLQKEGALKGDEAQAFRIFTETNDLLGLARLYDEGRGVEQDLIEASVLSWRASHNNNYDMCKDDRGCFGDARSLHREIDADLTPSQRERAEQIKAQRFPAGW